MRRRKAPPHKIVLTRLVTAIKLREFDNAIYVVQSTEQMAENGKNRLAIFTIFRHRRTDVKIDWQYVKMISKSETFPEKLQ